MAQCPGCRFHRSCHQHEAHSTHVDPGSHSLYLPPRYMHHRELLCAASVKWAVDEPLVCASNRVSLPLCRNAARQKPKRPKASRLMVGVNGRLSMAGTPRPELDHPGFFLDESTCLRALLAWHACLPSPNAAKRDSPPAPASLPSCQPRVTASSLHLTRDHAVSTTATTITTTTTVPSNVASVP